MDTYRTSSVTSLYWLRESRARLSPRFRGEVEMEMREATRFIIFAFAKVFLMLSQPTVVLSQINNGFAREKPRIP